MFLVPQFAVKIEISSFSKLWPNLVF